MHEKPAVCVTGASGFIGSRIAADLLSDGYRVRATVRDPDDDKYGFLRSLEGATDRLSLHPGKLLSERAFDEAMDGASCCIHTASPYVLDVEDEKTELVQPAVEGTLNVLRSARDAGVRRVVVTSSMAAITDEPDPNYTLTEDDWNTKSSLSRNPYYLSKVFAERAAWAFYGEQDTFSMAVINPFLVIGPSLSPSLNTSNELLVDLLSGRYPAIIRMAWGMVDVRDVSAAHMLAMKKEHLSGRFICANQVIRMKELVQMLRSLGYTKQLPSVQLDNKIGDYLTKLSALFEDAGTRTYMRTHVGRTPRFDNSRSKEILGLTYRPLKETLRDTVADLERWGHLQ